MLDRRTFATRALTASLAASIAPNLFSASTNSSNSNVRLGFIGVGGRGKGVLKTLLEMEGVQFPAICDVIDKNLAQAQKLVEESGRDRPEAYLKGPYDYRRMLERDDLHGVVIATPWRWHIPMSIDTLNAGKAVACEVGPANSTEECWELVRAAEASPASCMILENACYRRNMMALLNMTRQGLLGDVVQCRGGYLHDLRKRIVLGKGTGVSLPTGGDYRTRQNQIRNGDIYPTHGLGPLAQILDINRGNRFVSLSAFATKSSGLQTWTKQNLPSDHPAQNYDWAMGDVVTSIIQCQNGENIVLTHDCALPRPKSFGWQVQGSLGIYSEEANGIHIDGRSKGHRWEPFEKYQSEFEHPVWQRYQKIGIRGGHDGADFLELSAFVEMLRQDKPAPFDAYDMATWMAITPLSEQSIQTGGQPIPFPDFTNGKWMNRAPSFALT
jgi:predicted dehydrogenase